jgi:hypothetical protein
LIDRVIDITWQLHFGKSPCSDAVSFIYHFQRAFSNISLHSLWTDRQTFIHQKPYYVEFLRQEVREATKESIVGIWISKSYFSEEDIIVEMSHNILAMTIQWFLVAREAFQNRSLASTDPSTFFNRNGFAPSIISLKNDGQRIASQIAPMAKLRRKCPFHSSSSLLSPPTTTLYDPDLEELSNGEIVPRGEVLNTAKEFMAFGKGYRRCAGERLTHIFLDPDMGNIAWGFSRVR